MVVLDSVFCFSLVLILLLIDQMFPEKKNDIWFLEPLFCFFGLNILMRCTESVVILLLNVEFLANAFVSAYCLKQDWLCILLEVVFRIDVVNYVYVVWRILLSFQAKVKTWPRFVVQPSLEFSCYPNQYAHTTLFEHLKMVLYGTM